MTTDELSRAVAEIVGDDGFFPAERCPQGHSNYSVEEGEEYFAEVGALCHTCSWHFGSSLPAILGVRQIKTKEWQEAQNHAKDLTWHPEWRIGRGEPKLYAESLDLLVPVVEAWCERRWCTADVAILSPGRRRKYLRDAENTHEASFGSDSGPHMDAPHAEGKSAAEALARAFLAAVERWGA